MFQVYSDNLQTLQELVSNSAGSTYVNLYDLTVDDIKLLRPDECAVGLDINIVDKGLFKYWLFLNKNVEVAGARGHQRLDPSDFKSKTRRQKLLEAPEPDYTRDDLDVAFHAGVEGYYDLDFLLNIPDEIVPEEYFRDPDIHSHHWSLLDIIEFWCRWLPEVPMVPQFESLESQPGAEQYRR